MALKIWSPTDFIADSGWNGRDYPIPEANYDTHDIIYDNRVQNVSYIQAQLAGVFNEWFLSFFEDNYFKFVRIKTQSTLKDFKSFMKEIYKKEKPFLVIDPRPTEIVEDSIFAQNMLNRYNMLDPKHDNIGMKMMYALQIFHSDLFEMWFRRNRWRQEFDVMIMEESINRQTNIFNNIVMNIRHNSRFTLVRHVPVLLPTRHIKNIARFHLKNWESDEFVDFLNSISLYPIKKRYLGNGTPMFYMDYELHIHVEVPSFPAKDSAENTDAIELGARVTDMFIFTADLPSEFMFLTQKEYVGRFDRAIPSDPDAITFISPIYADMPWPTEIGDYKLTNRVDIEVQEGDSPCMDVIGLLRDFSMDVYETVKEYIEQEAYNISDLMKVDVYPNGSMKTVGSILHNNGVLELVAPQTNKLYTASIYVNLHNVNLIRKGKTTEYIGDIEKY